MNAIINPIASVLGYLMDFFFQVLSFVGYPRIWACVVLFAVTTRFLFLPQRINEYRNKLLRPIVNRELIEADPDFFKKTKDTEVTVARAQLKRETNKKYKVTNNSGCLTMLIQYPLLVALFYVVKNPQEFIPSLEAVASISPKVNSFLGLSLAAVPLDSLTNPEQTILILCVPFLVMFLNVAKMFSSLKLAKTGSQKFKVYGLCILFTLLIGWFSAKLPLAISLYWITNDITYYVFDYFIHKHVPKNKFVSKVISDYKLKVAQQQADQTDAAQEANETDTPVESVVENEPLEQQPVNASSKKLLPLNCD